MSFEIPFNREKLTSAFLTRVGPDQPIQILTKAAAQAIESTPGSIMDFACVLSTDREDRDHDILDPAGATIDEKAALLWSHQPDKPCGKYVKILSQNSKQISVQCAIADTELGRDVATLIKLGA